MRLPFRWFLMIVLAGGWGQFAIAADVIMNAAGHDVLFASSFDQPRLQAVLIDPVTGQVIKDEPITGDEAVFTAFIDTGASGFVISSIQAAGDHDNYIPSLDLVEARDSQGEFEEVGIGGTEVGWISPPRQLAIANGTPENSVYSAAAFAPHGGDYGLWVRREEGIGERILTYVDPVNIIGMPVIGQGYMIMDTTPVKDPLAVGDLFSAGYMRTDLVKPGADYSFPETNITIDIYMRDFNAGSSPPPPQAISQSSNPMIPGVAIADSTSGSTLTASGDWLLDTGASSTFISFAKAQECGLIGSQYTSVEDYLANAPGEILTTVVGGIGSETVTVPILNIDEIRIPDKNPNRGDAVWQNVDVLVLDIVGLDGVFGMNMVMPSVTIDAGDLGGLLGGGEELPLDAVEGTDLWMLLALLSTPSIVECDTAVFDPLGLELRLYSAAAPALVPGDADGDGDVDLVDFIALKTNFNTNGATREQGDFDFDGDVDLNDFIILKNSFTGGATVPEPATATLALLGGAGLASRRRRR